MAVTANFGEKAAVSSVKPTFSSQVPVDNLEWCEGNLTGQIDALKGRIQRQVHCSLGGRL